MANSNANSKLRNLDAVKSMIRGDHKSQSKTTVSFHGVKEQQADRQVGDVWVDNDGNTWEQFKGYKVQKGKLDSLREELNSYPNCRKEICTCGTPSQLDKKMRSIHGMCFDCVVDMEHELRLDGKYEEYERAKMRQNAMAWLKDSEQEVEDLKIAVVKAPEIVNVDGTISKWEIQYDPEKLVASIDEQFKNLKMQIFTAYSITEDDYVNFKTN